MATVVQSHAADSGETVKREGTAMWPGVSAVYAGMEAEAERSLSADAIGEEGVEKGSEREDDRRRPVYRRAQEPRQCRDTTPSVGLQAKLTVLHTLVFSPSHWPQKKSVDLPPPYTSRETPYSSRGRVPRLPAHTLVLVSVRLAEPRAWTRVLLGAHITMITPSMSLLLRTNTITTSPLPPRISNLFRTIGPKYRLSSSASQTPHRNV